jgi:AtzE family amidohydrolase
MTSPLSALETAAGVRAGRLKARDLVEDAFARIKALDPALNSFTRIFATRALDKAEAVDRTVAAGEESGPLAGVLFAAKDLFDVEGFATTAGNKYREGAPKAEKDAAVIAQLESAGAILIGAANMDEFAYGFSTENAHYGVTRNPHDLERLAGGSSGGSAAAVAAGFVSLSLGSDTNGSIRVPASLCGIYGLRPTHGLVPEEGVFPFIERMDVVGPFARGLEDLRIVFEVIAGGRCAPAICAIRAARLTGWFQDNAGPDAQEAVAMVCTALGASADLDLPLAGAGRSAAFLITAYEGGRRHLAEMRRDAEAFDLATRVRFAAGALLPDEMYADAETAAARFIAQFDAAFAEFDLLIAPSTPTIAPRIADGMIEVNGQSVSARANLGICTQPISITGAPALSVPIRRPGKMPIGVQLIAARGREDVLFAAARKLEECGIAGCDWPEAMKADV